MVAFKIVRKIGRMLRGGAGRREIFLGALCGVLIGFNPGANLTLALAILITLLLNANVGFTLLGMLVGRILCLVLAPVSFHTGFFIIHNIGLEGLFTKLVNAPVTALMDLNVYAMVGGLPYALAIGIAFGRFMDTTVTKIREQMVKAGEHDKVGKVAGNKLARFLMWLVFGKQKVSTADVLAKESPLLRKSGLILVGSVVAVGLLLEFFLLDLAVRKGLQSAIGRQTGAEVDIGKARLSLAQGKLEVENLQITDPDRLTHNLVQIDSLAADVSVHDLLRKTYTIDLLSGSTLKRNVLRDKPGKLLTRKEKPEPTETTAEKAEGKQSGRPLGDYFAKADDWKRLGAKAYEYLKRHEQNAESIARGEKPKASRKTAVADAKKLGYLKAAADLVADRPDWTISTIQITDVHLDKESPACILLARRVSSHPELLRQATLFALQDKTGTPLIQAILHFENPALGNELEIHLKDIALGNAVETSDSLPLDIKDGQADLKLEGTFTSDALDLPFTLSVHGLKANVEEGQTVLGMDAETATEVLSAMDTLEIDGALGGSLLSPRVHIDAEKLAASMKEALVAIGKKELSKRAGKELDKAKGQAGEELDKLLGGEEGGSTEEKAKGLFKKLF